jgi:hypothetical protein
MEKNKILALISLLDDPSDEVFSTVEGELLKEEVGIVPDLEKAWESTLDSTYQRRLENLIHTLQFKDVKTGLRQWLSNSDDDLLYGAYLVSKYQYPELRYEDVNNKINQIRKDIWLELNDHLTALEKVRIINHILFDVHGFTRNNTNFMAAQNTLICDVLDTRKGNPISLSVIYSVVAQRLGLPILGLIYPKILFWLTWMKPATWLRLVKEKRYPFCFISMPSTRALFWVAKKLIFLFVSKSWSRMFLTFCLAATKILFSAC